MSAVRPRSVADLAAPSQQSLLALAWLNFFLSGMQTAFGPIAAAGSAALFQLANASMMALLRGILAYEGKRQAAPLIAALIVAPQLLGGLLASWVGRSAEKHGRKPLLLVGFAPLPIRAALFALISNPLVLVVIQLLDIITGAVLGAMTAVVIADVTKGARRRPSLGRVFEPGGRRLCRVRGACGLSARD